MLTAFQAFSQFERDLIAERTKEGLESARARGRKDGKIVDSAFVKVKSIGGLNSSVNKELSLAICRVLKEKVNIEPPLVYINFTDVSASNWGNNSTTFG
jgi:hypothetical protein